MRVVEFFGLPGVGKTTLCDHLLQVKGRNQACARLDFTAWRKNLPMLKKIKFMAGAVIFSLGKVNNLGKFLFHKDRFPLHFYRRVFVFYPRCYFFEKFKNERNSNYCILDQWILQEIWSISATTGAYESKVAQKLLRSIAGDAIVIYLEVKVEEAVMRIVKRTHGESRFEGDSPESVHEKLADKVRFIDEIFRDAKQTGIKIYRLDGSRSQEKLQEEVGEILNGL